MSFFKFLLQFFRRMNIISIYTNLLKITYLQFVLGSYCNDILFLSVHYPIMYNIYRHLLNVVVLNNKFKKILVRTKVTLMNKTSTVYYK